MQSTEAPPKRQLTDRELGRAPLSPKQKGLAAAALVAGGLMVASFFIGFFSDRLDPAVIGDALGRLIVFLSVLAFFVTWLWAAGRRNLAGLLLVVVGVLVVFAVSLVSGVIERGHARFRDAANTQFTFPTLDGQRMLRHNGLGFQIAYPNGFYVQEGWILGDGGALWVFRTENQGFILKIVAYPVKVGSSEALQQFATAVVNRYAQAGDRVDLGTTLLAQSVTWTDHEHSIHTNGRVGPWYFHLRAVSMDTGYPGHAMAIAAMVSGVADQPLADLVDTFVVDRPMHWSVPR